MLPQSDVLSLKRGWYLGSHVLTIRKETQNRRIWGNSLAEVNLGEVCLKEAPLKHVIILPFIRLLSTFQMGLKQDFQSPYLPLGLLATSPSEIINFSLEGSYHSFLIDCPLLGKIEGRRRRGRQRTRWLDDITDSMDMILSKLREMLKDEEALCAAVHEELDCKEWDTTEQLKNNKDITAHFLSQAGPESILGGPASFLPHTLTPSGAILPTPVVLIPLTTGDPQSYSSWLEVFPKLCLALFMLPIRHAYPVPFGHLNSACPNLNCHFPPLWPHRPFLFPSLGNSHQ